MGHPRHPRLLVSVLCALVPGCYLWHGLEEVRDTGVVVRDTPIAVRDAPPALIDIGPTDAGPPPRCTYAPTADRQVTNTEFSAHAPRIGWDGEAIGLVVFESDGSIPHPVVSFTRLDRALEPRLPLTVVGEESHSWGEAAWDPAVGFGLCWNGDPGGRSRTLVRVRRPDGNELAGPIEVEAEGQACEAMARARGRWGIIYRHGRETVSMRAAVLDDAGAIHGTPFDLDPPLMGSGRGGFLASDGEGFIAGVAVEGLGIQLTRIDGEGTASTPMLIPAPRARYGAIAMHDDGTLGVLIRDGAREVGGLRFVRVRRDMTVDPRDTLLVEEGRGVRHPRLVAVPDGWVALWVEQGDSSRPATAAVLAHLDRDGVAIEPRRRLVDGENSGYGGPSLLHHDGDVYAAISRPRAVTPSYEQAFVTRLSCEMPARPRCAPMDAVSSGDLCTEITGWAWNGLGCGPVVCGCVGTECDRIAVTESECRAEHRECF